MKEKIKKLTRYISGVIIIFVAVAILFSGIVSIPENIIEFSITGIVAGLLTIAIGLYLGRIGLKLFKQEEFGWSFFKKEK